jgi:hypothetical protein
MRMRRVVGMASLLVFLLLSSLPEAVAGGNNAAKADEAITLSVSKPRIRFGGSTELSGVIDPVAADQTVLIVDDAGAAVAEAITDAAGAFEVVLEPRHNLVLHAQWSTVTKTQTPRRTLIR